MEAIGRLWMPLLPTPVADPAYLALVRFEQLDLGFVEVDLDIGTDNLDHFLNRNQHLLAAQASPRHHDVAGPAALVGQHFDDVADLPVLDPDRAARGDLVAALAGLQLGLDRRLIERVLADAQLLQKSLPSAGAGSVPASVSASGAEAPAARVSILPRAASSLASQIFRYLRASPTALSVSSRLSLPSSSWRSLSSNASRACS